MYVDLEGPANDPKYNETTTEAKAYGASQASTAAYNYYYLVTYQGVAGSSYPIIFMDLEAGNPGWLAGNPNGLNRAVFDGFWNNIGNDVASYGFYGFVAGLYSGPGFYSGYLDESLTGTWYWEASAYYTGSGSPGSCTLDGLSINGWVPQASFGQSPSSSSCYMGWQWATMSNPGTDWDQLDQNRLSDSCG